MKPLVKEKALAIKLRKQGLSYSEILEHVSVSESSLSLWLRDIPLSKSQQARLDEKFRSGRLLGAQARARIRAEQTQAILASAEQDIKKISERELWLMGIMLYWAEGSKEKPGAKYSGYFDFCNSDPMMIKLMLRWLIEICEIPKKSIVFDLHIHENHRYRIAEVLDYWSIETGFPVSTFRGIQYKQHNILTKRTNTRDNYKGLIRISVRCSTKFLRKISGWIQGVNKQLWGVV